MLEHWDEKNTQGVLWDSYMTRARGAVALKNFQEAVRMCEMALQKAMPFGVDDWRTIETQRLMSCILMQCRQYEKAQTVLSTMLVSVYSKHGGSSPELIEVARNLAIVLEHRGYYARASRLMLHIMHNHPQRLTNPDDEDYKFVKRKYHALKSKANDVDAPSQIAWLG